MTGWDAVAAHALALPGATSGTSYGAAAVKVRGRTIIAATAPDPGSFVLHLPLDEKEVLLDTDPDTFWQTPHYDGWPAVLVRYAAPAGERVRTLIERAWWDRAGRTLRAGRPRP